MILNKKYNLYKKSESIQLNIERIIDYHISSSINIIKF